MFPVSDPFEKWNEILRALRKELIKISHPHVYSLNPFISPLHEGERKHSTNFSPLLIIFLSFSLFSLNFRIKTSWAKISVIGAFAPLRFLRFAPKSFIKTLLWRNKTQIVSCQIRYSFYDERQIQISSSAINSVKTFACSFVYSSDNFQ